MDNDSPERHLPFDAVLKPLLLFFHFAGFSIIMGAFYFDEEPLPVYVFLVAVSGCLLIFRELYEEGFVWFLKTEGLLTIAKVVMLSACAVSGAFRFPVLLLAILLGTATSHLPKQIKKRIWITTGHG